MKILLIGSGGQLGTDLYRLLTRQGHCVVGLTHSQLDVCDHQQVERTITDVAAKTIINTAAYHKVDECEGNPERAFRVNAIAAGNLATLAERYGAVLVHFSTDYVFGGTHASPRAETDAADPINVYGISKVAGERLIASRCTRNFVLRTCGLYGVAGSSGKGGNFVELMLRKAQQGDEIRVVDDQIVTPTFTEDLARVTSALLDTLEFGVYHASSEGQCSWYEFARAIFEIEGIRANLHPVPSAHYRSAARRPAFSVLSKGKLNRLGVGQMPHWREALTRYLQQRPTTAVPVSADRSD